MKPPKNDALYFLLLIAAGAVFYILNLQTPFSHDDYAYCFYYGPDSSIVRPTNIRVTGWLQMVQSMWNHYLCVNGRFSSHLILQSFCAFFGKGAFNFVNSLVFLLLLHTLVTVSNCRNSVSMLAIVFITVLCLLPFPGQTMLWMTGSLNYLWPATFSLVFVFWIFKHGKHHAPFWKHLLLFFIGLAVGWSNESLSIPVTIGLFLYFLFNRDSFRNKAISSSLGYALGTVLILISPGTWQRAQGWENVLNQRSFIHILFIHSYNLAWGFIHSILPLIAFFVAIFTKKLFRRPFVFIRKNILVWLFLGFCCFLFALGWDQLRIYFGVSVLSLVIALRSLRPISLRLDRHLFLSLTLVAACAIPSIIALRATAIYQNYDKRVYSEVRLSPPQCIVKDTPFGVQSRYVYSTSLKPDKYAFHNRVKSFYFEKDFIQALPSDLYDIVVTGKLGSSLTPLNVDIDGSPLSSYKDYWVLPVKEIPAKQIVAVCYYTSDNSKLKPRQMVIRYLLNTTTRLPEEHHCYGIESGGEKFLVFSRFDERHLSRIQLSDYIE